MVMFNSYVSLPEAREEITYDWDHVGVSHMRDEIT